MERTRYLRLQGWAGLGAMVGALLGLAGATTTSAAPSSPNLPNYLPSSWTVSGQPMKQPGEAIDRATRGVLQHARYGRFWQPQLDNMWRVGYNGTAVWPGGRVMRTGGRDNREGWGSYGTAWGGAVGCRDWDATLPTSPTDPTPVTATYPYCSNENLRYGYNLDDVMLDKLCVSNSNGAANPIVGYSRLETAEISRWLPPQVIVNGKVVIPYTDTYGTTPGSPAAGNGLANYAAARRGVVDPTLRAEVVQLTAFRMAIGVDIYRTTYNYTCPPDWDYLVQDFAVINTGNLDRDAAIDRPAKAINDFRFATGFEHTTSGVANGMINPNRNKDDDFIELIYPWASDATYGTRSAYLAYDGDGSGIDGPDWGDPAQTVSGTTQTMGKDLFSKAYMAFAYLFAESSPGSGVDDPTQPASFTYFEENGYRLGRTRPGWDQGKAFKMIWCGHENAATNAPTKVIPPNTPTNGTAVNATVLAVFQGLVGPQPAGWTLPAGGTYRVVAGIAAGGISDRLSKDLAFATLTRDAAGQPAASRQTASEIALIQSGRDSALRTLDRMFWNVNGFVPGGRYADKPAAYNQAFNVPDPPRPPACFWVSNSDRRIDLEWTREAETTPDFDTGVNDFAGYRVYRAASSPDSDWVLVKDLPKASLPTTGTTVKWSDAAPSVSRDFTYFYYVVAYDDGTQNWDTTPGIAKSLESGKYYTTTGWDWSPVNPGFFASPSTYPMTHLDSVIVVPNPYNSRSYNPKGAQGTIDRIFFKNLPQAATIRIYTAAGSPVKTLYHFAAPGAADGASIGWDMSNDVNQVVATGVYIYTVECTAGPAQGRTAVGKFIIIR